MNRRTVLKQIAISSAAAFLFPSCYKDSKDQATYVKLNNISVTAIEKDLIANLADVIIPETDTPGARKLEGHVFTLVMVDDCLGKEDQARYLKGMRSFEESMYALTGKSFDDATVGQRTEILKALEQNQDKVAEEVNYFYRRTRGYLVQSYVTSQHFLTTVKEYKLVPGPDFKGCAPVTDQSVA
jgi:hypothetical protein